MAKHSIQPLLRKTYLKAVSAKGIYIYDERGRSYIDGSSGPVACSIGHSHPDMLPVMKQQLDKLQYVYRSQFGSTEADCLAEQLYRISPGGKYCHTFFVNSGSEAIETAMKIALQYWREKGQPEKIQFISRQKSYHGITMGALSISGHQIRRKQFENSLLKGPSKLVMDLESDPMEKHIQEIESIVNVTGSGNIAAIVAEPVIGAAGTALVPPEGYYQEIRALCDQHRILFIADEVMTGIGRTGSWFALDHWSITADIVAIGKSLGAGYAPIAATLITSSILEAIKSGSGIIMSGHTYSGHPFSCAAASQVLKIIDKDSLIQNVNKIGKMIINDLDRLKGKYDFIQTVRGKGLLLGIELTPSSAGLQMKIIDRCFENGLLVYPSVGGHEGTDENGILIAPPYIISESETRHMMDILDQSLHQVSTTL